MHTELRYTDGEFQNKNPRKKISDSMKNDPQTTILLTITCN